MKRKKLQALRKKSGFKSRKEFALQIGVSSKHYESIENGQRNPSIEVAKQIAEVLGTNDINIF